MGVLGLQILIIIYSVVRSNSLCIISESCLIIWFSFLLFIFLNKLINIRNLPYIFNQSRHNLMLELQFILDLFIFILKFHNLMFQVSYLLQGYIKAVYYFIFEKLFELDILGFNWLSKSIVWSSGCLLL